MFAEQIEGMELRCGHWQDARIKRAAIIKYNNEDEKSKEVLEIKTPCCSICKGIFSEEEAFILWGGVCLDLRKRDFIIIGNNSIESEGAVKIFRKLRYNSTVTYINFSKIHFLYLLGNNELGKDGIESLSSCLEVNGTLTFLNISKSLNQ